MNNRRSRPAKEIITPWLQREGGARMAHRQSVAANHCALVCVVSFPKQQSKCTQRSVSWPRLEEGLKSADLPAA